MTISDLKKALDDILAQEGVDLNVPVVISVSSDDLGYHDDLEGITFAIRDESGNCFECDGKNDIEGELVLELW